MGFWGFRFYLLLQWDYEFENHTLIWIRLHILHLLYATSLTNLCFRKKTEQEKKVYIKVFLNRFMLILVIYNNRNSMWYLVTFNEIFFLTSQKGGGTAGVNHLKVKNDVTYWKTVFPVMSQIHAAPDFLLLSRDIASLRRNNLLLTTTPGYKGWQTE